ncbi:MAG: glycosyltransferase [Terracidiphilus sp.]
MGTVTLGTQSSCSFPRSLVPSHQGPFIYTFAVMPHALAQTVEIATTALTAAGMGYFLASLIAAWVFLRQRRAPHDNFAPGVSILKSLKGVDPGMMDAFRSHCRQNYSGEYELLFGISSHDDPAAVAVERLQNEFPERAIRLVQCPEQLGTNGKVSTLVQLARLARHDFLLINDSDITVGPHYLLRVMAGFGDPATEGAQSPSSFTELDARAETGILQHGEGRAAVGLVTALYRGRAHRTLPSRIEALAIATEFAPGVLLSKMIEGGLHYGLGSTLAVRREALEKAGGLLPLVDYLADDYELGARVARAGYRVELSAEVVETGVPAYDWCAFRDHQLRWLRTVREARPAGYAGLVFTHGLGWALLNVLASGLSPVSLWLLGLSFFLRLAQAMTVGASVLRDHQVLEYLWLLPFRDVVAIGLWVAGFAGDTVVWRGEQFVLKNGKLEKEQRS